MTYLSRSRKSFTLLELMVAFIIMAVLSAIAIPSLIGVVGNDQGTANSTSAVAVADAAYYNAQAAGGATIDAAGTAGYIPNGSTIVSVADGTTTIGGVPTPILVFNFGGTDNVCVIAPKAPELPAPPWLTPLTVPWPLLEPQLPALVVLRLLWLP